MKTTRWKILPCPKNAGRHPYRDHRWIATEDAEVEWSHSGLEWTLKEGSLICEMRDVDPKFARLIVSAPELLNALTDAYRELVADDIVTKVIREEKRLPHTENPVLEKIRAAIARATALTTP